MTSTEGLDLSAAIEERIQWDSDALEEIQEQMADLILIREIIESLQAARMQGVGHESTKVTPTSWAEFVRLPLSTEDSPRRNIDESRQRLTQALGRVGAAFDIPDAQVKVAHSHKADTLVIDTNLF